MKLGTWNQSEGIFAEPCEAKKNIHPCGKPQGFLAKKGKTLAITLSMALAILTAMNGTAQEQKTRLKKGNSQRRQIDRQLPAVIRVGNVPFVVKIK